MRHASYPTQEELAAAIQRATRAALVDLFREHAEHFYYITLITTGEALPPFLTAWSAEALASAAEVSGAGSERDLKWSYADSPYMDYGAAHFSEVRRLFASRPAMDPFDLRGWHAEYAERLAAMESAMKQLDEDGVFGRDRARDGVIVNVEVMPPDHTNTERAKRLNPKDSPALRVWLEEAAER